MRRCLPGDLFAAASLLAFAADPTALIDRLITQADAAHRYAKRFGRAHPVWGNGSLMARALIEQDHRPPQLHSAAFLAALALVAGHLAARKHFGQAK